MANDSNGYIKLFRQVCGWGWYKNVNTFKLFIHLLLSANFTDGIFEGHVIHRGQVARSLQSLSSESGLSLQEVRTALKHLIATGEVTYQSNRRYIVITVVKYDDFQSATDKSTSKQHATNMQTTCNQHATNMQLTFNQQQYKNIRIKEEQEEQEEKEITPSVSSSSAPTWDDIWFDEFWMEYPRKVAKADAMKAWKQIKITPALMGKIMSGLEMWKRSGQWTRDGGQYIPYPASWLRGKRWEDAVEPAQPQRQAPAPRRNSADNFDQRDYSGVDQELMSGLADEIRRMREEDGG